MGPIEHGWSSDDSRGHGGARVAQLRGENLFGIAIEEYPRHGRKSTADKRQRFSGEAVEFDEVADLRAGSFLTERAQHRVQPGGSCFFGNCDGTREVIDRAGFGDHDILRQGGKHSRNQGRAAAGHVEDETGGRNSGAGGMPGDEFVDRRAMGEQAVEGQTLRMFDSVVEKWMDEAFTAEPAPFDLEVRALWL